MVIKLHMQVRQKMSSIPIIFISKGQGSLFDLSERWQSVYLRSSPLHTSTGYIGVVQFMDNARTCKLPIFVRF